VNTLILTIHVIACISLVLLVLLQSGHEGMGVIFGGSSSTFFGSTGAGGLLSKLTITMAVIFFVTSLTFTYMDAQKHTKAPESVILEDSGAPPQSQQPAAPAEPEAGPKAGGDNQ
jgi:preprotein translocase subunit SecG